MASKFLYLTKEHWRLAWNHGGVIPIFPARKYLSEERSGTLTPDERIRTSKGAASVADISKGFKFPLGMSVSIKNLSINLNDGRGALPVDYETKPIIGYIISLSNNYSRTTQVKLGKECCIKIKDVDSLCSVIAAQLGVIGQHKRVLYTVSDDRDVFLKSSADHWQDEYRLFFPVETKHSVAPTWVNIPSGTAFTDRADFVDWKINSPPF
jgi:hypothetical protein